MFKVVKEGDNTLPSTKIPIVFVPGVMGSRLYFPDINEYWDPNHPIRRMTHWVRISAERARQELHFAARGQVMTEGLDDLEPNERDRGWEGVAWDFYGPFLRWLNNESFFPNTCPVYAAGYDWRQPNRASGAALAARIENVLERERAEKVILVTHSMGGIVTRAALKQKPSLGDKVNGVIHVVQPVTGAVKFYRMCYTGAMSEYDGGKIFASILGSNALDFQTIVSGLPGPVQLMPTNQYRYWDFDWLFHRTGKTDTAYPGTAYMNYRETKIPPGAVDPRGSATVRKDLMDRIVEADAFHEWLRLFKLEDKTWAIYGTGLESDHQAIFKLDKPIGKNNGYLEQRPAEGDGTVPGPSAAALFPKELKKKFPVDKMNWKNHQFEVKGVEHGAAFNSNDVRNIVKAFIKLVR
jgi:pimeloyl-ACP methyl ester carboxylesterase